MTGEKEQLDRAERLHTATLQAVLGWAVGVWTGAVLGLAGAATRAGVEIRSAAAGREPGAP